MACFSAPTHADTVEPHALDIEAAMKGRYSKVVDFESEKSPWLHNEKKRPTSFDSCISDLGALVAKARSLRAQLAARSARRFSNNKDVSATARSARRKTSPVVVVAAETTPAALAVRVVDEPSEPASSPYGALICAENWKAIDVRRHRQARGGGGGGGGTFRRQSRSSTSLSSDNSDGSSSSSISISNREQHLSPDRYRRTIVGGSCEPLYPHEEEIYEGRFQSLDRALALRGTTPAAPPAVPVAAVSSTAEKLLVIIERVMEEDASSSSDGGMWEDPDSTLAEEEGCPDCEAQREKRGLQVDSGGGDVLARGGASVARWSGTTCASCSPAGDAGARAGGLDEACSLGSGVSPGARNVTAKDLEAPERMLVTPPPSYVPWPAVEAR